MMNALRTTCLIALSVLTGCDGGGALSVPRVLGPKTPTCDDPEALQLTSRVIQQSSGQVNRIGDHSLLESEMILVRGIDKEIGKASCVASFVFVYLKDIVTTSNYKAISRTEFELQYDTTGQLVSTIQTVGPLSYVKLSEDEVKSLNENPTDPIAQYNLGLMYDKGEGVGKNDAEAVKWYRRAADQGDATAQNNLGVMYDNGEGVAENDAEAVKWYRRAADQGDASAQNNLGVMYAKGEGVAKSAVEAVKWFRLAADQGLASAQSNLAWMYSYGKGVTQDSAEAVKWYRKAANQGNALAQYSLGEVFYAGDEFGGVADESRARVEWTRVLKSADKESQEFKLAQAGFSCIDRGVPSKSCAPLRCSIEGRSDCPDL